MAKVTYIDPIATLSGKIVKRHHTTYMVRQAATSNPRMLSNPCYTTSVGSRQTPVSQTEQEYRQRFGSICVATSRRLRDASQMSADQAAFRAQHQYRTLRQYVWHQVAATIE